MSVFVMINSPHELQLWCPKNPTERNAALARPVGHQLGELHLAIDQWRWFAGTEAVAIHSVGTRLDSIGLALYPTPWLWHHSDSEHPVAWARVEAL